MPNESLSSSPEEPVVFTSWKDIAGYLGKGVRTVQRWEKAFALPVRRPKGVHHKSAILAHRSELDAWLASRWLSRSPEISDFEVQWGDPIHAPSSVAEAIENARALRKMNGMLLQAMTQQLNLVREQCRNLRLAQALGDGNDRASAMSD